MNKATNAKKQILASQIAYKRTQNNEVQLEKALAKFFNKLKKEVLNALDDYWKDYQMLQGHIDLITAPVHEAHKEYYELLTLYIKREYKLGSAEAKRLVRLANSKQRVASKSMRMPVRAIIKKDNDLFGTLPSAEERLLNRTFTASERTLSRVDSQINQIITDGYRSGKGINDVANSLNQRFDQLTTWESKRIARTEIHNAHNTAVMDTYEELDVEYTMWIAANDDRVRDSHIDIDGEIIPIGSEYSNGLKYPGDTSGDIEEWINCRCSNAPFVVPYGYMAPSFSPFRESDLIKTVHNVNQRVDELIEKPKPVKVYEDVDKGKPIMVYEYEDYTIGIHKNVKYTDIDEITTHLDNLPKELLNHNSKIYVMDVPEPKGNAGTFTGRPGGDVRLWDMKKTFKDDALKKTVEMTPMDVLNHELAHAVDYSTDSIQLKYSFPKDYEKIVKADNKLYSYVNEKTGRRRTPDVFPTSYAGRSYTKYKRDSFLKHERYIEDFAESTKLYLNPKYHKELCDTFPNRAKYLEKIYGKPKFK